MVTIAEQSGKTAVVTGANSGIGFVTALELARARACVVLACRDLAKGCVALERISDEVPGAELDLARLDLADLGSVRSFASEVSARHQGTDLLVNNAGIMAVPQRRITADGFELQFGTNHLGHFALTGLLLDHLLRRPEARIVTVSSAAHTFGRVRLDDLHAEKRYRPWRAYAQSKLANLLFAFELDRMIQASGVDLMSSATHPGYAATNLQFSGPRLGRGGLSALLIGFSTRLFAQSDTAGALPTLYAATSPEAVSGGFYGPRGSSLAGGAPALVRPARRAFDEATASQLWEDSERLTGVRYDALA